MGLLAGGIAHDFNNIVAGILGNASLAKFSFQDKDLAVLLEQIEQGCYRAKDLTKQLLTFSKGGMPILEKTDIRELIMSSTDFTLSGSKVKALYSFCDDCKFLTLDKAQFKQVIYNLVLNSLQAMPKGGTISISTELYENEEDTLDLVTGNYLLIKVSDQGLGIDNSALKLIFDPYYTTKFQGNGLGLSVCYSIVRKHNGKITVYSEKNKGTQINIYLPTDLDRNLLPSKQKEDEISLTTIKKASKVLIVDDEEMIRNILEQILKKLGHEVIFCDRGEAAIKIYNDLYQKNNPPDLLILDLTIPGGINGVDCFKQIKMINREVKAVLTSGYIDSSDVKNLLDIGFFAVLNKPFGFKQVVKIINRALGE